MIILQATIMAALLAVSSPLASLGGDGVLQAHPAFITREWTWTDGTTTTTFTAHGPSEQVNSLDPQVSPLDCQDCQLASSVQFAPDDEAALTEVAE